MFLRTKLCNRPFSLIFPLYVHLSFYALLSIALALVLLFLPACPDNNVDDENVAVATKVPDEKPTLKSELVTKIDERDTIHPANSVLGIHKFDNYPDGLPFAAAASSNGRRVFFVDKSLKDEMYAVFSVEMPGDEAVEVFTIPSVPEKLIAARNGMTVFALCREGGFLYSMNERRLFARVDYQYAAEAFAISPDGMVFSCWGGDHKSPYNFTRYFDSFTSTAFWGTPIPSERRDIYGIDPVEMFPSFGLTQMIVQVGDMVNPSFAFITMNTHQHGYKATEAIAGFLARGSLSQDGLVYRALYSPPESSLAKSADGAIPYTHRAIIDMTDMGFSLEPLKAIITGAPMAIDRIAESYLIKTDKGDIEIRSLDSNKAIYSASKNLIGDCSILGWASDLKGVLVVSDDELRWIDITRFQSASTPESANSGESQTGVSEVTPESGTNTPDNGESGKSETGE